MRRSTWHGLQLLLFPAAILVAGLAATPVSAADSAAASTTPTFRPRTRVRIVDGLWQVGGKWTHEGSRAEGLLLNVRFVNATFEDSNDATRPKGFDADANTAKFLAALPDYVAHGVNAITLCMQGGFPGYEGAVNSAYTASGEIRPSYSRRVARVIEACDRAGVVVILGCFYQRQDQILRDADAVRKALVNTVEWLRSRGYTNVILEVANEFPHSGFDHPIIRTPTGMKELVLLAKKTWPELLVSSSGMGNGRLPHAVGVASDLVLIHFNGTPVNLILQRVAAADKISKPIVCNEDDKVGEEGARALETAIDAICSWGYMNKTKNQYAPFEFDGARDDPAVYAKFRELSRKEG